MSLLFNVNALIITDNTYLNNPINPQATSQLISLTTDKISTCYITANGINNQSLTTSNGLNHTYDFPLGSPIVNDTTYNYSIDCFSLIPTTKTFSTDWLTMSNLNPLLNCSTGNCVNTARLTNSNYPSGVYHDFTLICPAVLGSNWVYQTHTVTSGHFQMLRVETDLTLRPFSNTWLNGQVMNTVTCQGLNSGNYTFNSSNSSLFRTAYINLNVTIDTPFQDYNFTFDEFKFDLNITTDKISTCYYSFQNNETIFNNTNSLNHNTKINLPIATQNIQNLVYDIRCSYQNHNFTKILQVNKDQIPLSFDILVPTNEQVFNSQTSNIQFDINTNYQSNCYYKDFNETNYILFSNTGSSSHQTNFSVNQSKLYYNMSFLCDGIIINTNVSSNIGFYLKELIVIPNHVYLDNFTNLIKTTSQLPQVGSDIGDFMSNTTPGITEFIFNLSIINVLILLLGFVLYSIKAKLF